LFDNKYLFSIPSTLDTTERGIPERTKQKNWQTLGQHTERRQNLVKHVITFTEMGNLPGFSYTINFGADCVKCNMFLQSLKSFLCKIKMFVPCYSCTLLFQIHTKIMGKL